ncbi:MAG: HAD family hydrolase [Planctomycetes bacterium]|nr:HAD family hydrolase [Planctomycetota bacterium]
MTIESELKATHSDAPGVIFDLDGTLADTLLDLTSSVNHALASLGFAAVEPVGVRRMVGDGLPMLIERAAGTRDPRAVSEMVTRFTDHHGEHYLDHTALYPGTAELLAELVGRGCPMAVLSNKPHHFTIRVHDALLTDWPFVAVEGASDRTPRKPDPHGALGIVARMDRSPQNTFMVGDTIADIETARRVGMKSIAVTWGFRDADELAAAGPDFVADHPEQIGNFVGAR